MKLCALSDLHNDTSKEFIVAEKSIFVVKKEGKVFAYHNNCPHLSVRLEYRDNDFLDSEKQFIICSNHGALFHIEDGYCVFGPCQGRSLKKLSLKIDEGYLYLLEMPF